MNKRGKNNTPQPFERQRNDAIFRKTYLAKILNEFDPPKRQHKKKWQPQKSKPLGKYAGLRNRFDRAEFNVKQMKQAKEPSVNVSRRVEQESRYKKTKKAPMLYPLPAKKADMQSG